MSYEPLSKASAERLLGWYLEHRRELPWRKRPSSYRIWVSEVMLQQTQVETVVPYYRRFLRRFPSLKRLAEAEESEVLALWSGLGYYRRARSLHRAAREVVEKYGGRFPRELREALSLPGVGPYTAGAILSIAYNISTPVLDGNVERVLTRLRSVTGDPSRSAVKDQLRSLAQAWIPAGRARDFNQALMELGALVCSPLDPSCRGCPLARDCQSKRDGTQLRFPEKAKAKPTVALHLAVAIVENRGRFLLEYRDADTPGSPSYLRGLWNFPSVELAEGSSAREAVEEYLSSRLGGRFSLRGPIGKLSHAITFRRFTVSVWTATGGSARDIPARSGVAWYPREALGRDLAVPSLVTKVLRVYRAARDGP